MKPRTQEYLAKAERNRDTARALIDPVAPIRLSPPPFEWALVAVFYAAVHYAHALLFERHGIEPTSHKARRDALSREREFQAQSPYKLTVLQHYLNLADLAYQARYPLGFTAQRIDVDGALYVDLDAVRRAVYGALQLPLPP